MASKNPSNLEQNTHGIILRTSSAFSGRYAYIPLPHAIPTDVASNLHNIIADSLANAPHFPYITLLDSVSTNILYLTCHTFPNLFHVYNLINQTHFAISFPYLVTFINAAILIRDCTHFKVLVVCINEHPNPLSSKEGDNRTRPFIFYIYSSGRENWSLLPYDFSLTSNHLLPNRRKPAHVGEDIVYLDLTNHFLVTYSYSKERIELIPKLVTIWEQVSMKLDESTRYGESRGKLHCVKFNLMRTEIHKEVELPKGLWMLVVAGKVGSYWGKVVGIHPDDEGVVLVRSTDIDAILMVNVQRDFSRVVIAGKGPNCGPSCFHHGMNNVLEASTSKGMQRSSCGIFHPHENIEGPEGEVFIISHFGTNLILLPPNVYENY
ncbi:hypothetical protein MA16_Dca007975 [Dendrobium catenatum]|uniref:Uncharacterized protein n=1 Tax=Dendrobium catenatum TaxID=906689 RepID=A0A2I0VKX9_9ASPA|nr:hypothetical protein MA16_Dca007975 [Dendrobium catenatum]